MHYRFVHIIIDDGVTIIERRFTSIMTDQKIDGWVAGLKVLEEWGVQDVFGIPAGSLNSLMDAFEKEQENINFH